MKTAFIYLACLFLPMFLHAQEHTLKSIQIYRMSPNSMELAVLPEQDFYTMVHTGVDTLSLLQFNPAGQLTWGRHFTRKLQNSFELVALADGAALFAAMDFTGNNGDAIFLGKINRSGNVVWAKRLENPGNGLSMGNLQAVGNGFLLTAGNAFGAIRSFLMRFDENGDLLWNKLLQSGSGWSNPVTDAAGNVFAIVQGNNQSPRIAKLDAGGTVLWTKAYDSGDELSLFELFCLPDNSLVCAGRSSDDPFIYPDYWLLKLDNDGQVLWSNTYPYATLGTHGFTYYYTLREAANKSIFLQMTSGATDNALFRFDENGQFEQGWYYPQSNNLTDLESVGDHELLSVGEKFAGNQTYKLNLYRFNQQGRLDACCAEAVDLLTEPQPSVVTDVTLAPVAGIIQVSAETLSATPVDYLVQTSCALPTITPSDTFICRGDCVQFQVLNPDPDQQYSWSFPGGDPASIDSMAMVEVCYNTPGRFPVILTARQGACSVDVRDSIKVCNPDLTVNAFSPNGDGANDDFQPTLYFATTDYHFTVYNRWGQAVFETFDRAERWDGTQKGEASPSDVYVWTVDCLEVATPQNIRKKLHGEVTLIR